MQPHVQQIKTVACTGTYEYGYRHDLETTPYGVPSTINIREDGYGLINIETPSDAERILLKVSTGRIYVPSYFKALDV